MMVPQPPPVFVVPGMHVGCRPYYAIMRSTLECLFDSVCFTTLSRWISNLPLSALPNVLNRSAPSRFPPNTTVDTIFKQQMIEEWHTTKNFSSYFTACAPIQCTYTFSERNGFLYVFTTLISSFGGLMVVMRMLAPLIVNLASQIRAYCSKRDRTNRIDEDTSSGIVLTIMLMNNRFKLRIFHDKALIFIISFFIEIFR